MDYQHIIEKGTLIYSSLPSDRKLRSWQIRESQCTVMFYEKEPLTDIETIILKLLYSCEGEEVTREELGMKLGFDMANRLYENVQFYEDRAEKVFFKKLLESSFKWKLIVEESNVLIFIMTGSPCGTFGKVSCIERILPSKANSI